MKKDFQVGFNVTSSILITTKGASCQYRIWEHLNKIYAAKIFNAKFLTKYMSS